MIHHLLPDGVACCLKHLLNSPEKDYVITAQLNSKEKNQVELTSYDKELQFVHCD